MALIISPSVLEKLRSKHQVAREEVEQCFANRTHSYLFDTREEHLTDPLTRWFIAETDFARKLKVAYILKDGDVYLRSAFPPNEEEMRIYRKYSKSL